MIYCTISNLAHQLGAEIQLKILSNRTSIVLISRQEWMVNLYRIVYYDIFKLGFGFH